MDQELISQIRESIDIVDIVSEYIPLSKHGKNFFGVCPFHDDTNPSMSVSREKQIFRCFSCGASGNVFTFVEKYEQISFMEAVKLLADKIGMKTEGLNISKKVSINQTSYEIYDLTNKFYQNNMLASLGSQARNYLKERQIDDALIKEFEIGLSSGVSNQLTKLLEKKGYALSELNAIGLSNKDNDIYQDRIMFPLWDINGKCVAFSGRRYKTDEGSKYINTKETKIFTKGQMLYNYHRAKEFVRLKKQVIVMEGFMDVIRAFTVDVKNTIALMGTAMTKEQAQLIKRLSQEVVLCLDGDGPGQHAIEVNGEVLEKQGLTVKVACLPDPDDPDSYILKHGKESFQNIIESAISFQDFKIKRLKQGRNLNSDLEKTNYIHDVLKEASKITDEIRREIILKNLAIEFNLSYNTLEKELSKEKLPVPREPEIVPENIKKHDKYYMAPRIVLYYMMDRSDVLDYYNKEGIFFPEEKFRLFASEIAYYQKKYQKEKISLADFESYLQDRGELLTILREIMSFDIDSNITFDAVLDYVQVMECDYKNREIKRLKEMIKNTTDLDLKMKLSEKVRSLKIGS